MERLSHRGVYLVIGRFIILIGMSIQEFSRNNCHGVAAGIAYWTLLSLFPLTLGTMAVLGYAFRDLEDQARVVDALVGALPIASDYLHDTVAQIVGSRTSVGVLATVGLILSGVAVLSAVRTGVNHAWGIMVPARFWLRRYQDLGMFVGIVLIAFLLLVGVNPFAGFWQIEDMNGGLGFPQVPIWWRATREAIALATTWGALALLYRYLPNTQVAWRDLSPGILVGGLFIEGTKLAFGGVLGLANNYSLVYGSIGALVSVLAWAYFSALGLLFGAQVCAVYSRRAENRWQLHLYLDDEEPVAGRTDRTLRLLRAFVLRLNLLRDRPS